MAPVPQPISVRFFRHVEKTPTCWIWTGSRLKHGYGRFKVDGRRGTVEAHRVSYELAYGEVPNGLSVLHRCDNPPCVNPEHLFLGTQAENMGDMKRKGRQVHGERVHGAKLTWKEVGEIRERSAAGETSIALGKSFGVSSSVVRRIVQEKIWKSHRSPLTSRAAAISNVARTQQ